MVYVYTAGNDTINYFNEMDNLVIANAKWTSQRTDNTVTVEGKGTITMNCDTAWGSQVNIVDDLSKVKSYVNIGNDKDGKTVKGSAANDNIYNGGNNVSINAGNGFNRISNGEWYNDEQGALRGHRTTITSGKDDDVIWNAADYVLINAGDGDDAVDNIHAKTSVTINGGERVKIFGGKGNDTINNWKEGNSDTIGGGEGKDSITNYGGSGVSISGGDGDDFIGNYKDWNWNEETQLYEITAPDNATIIGGAGYGEFR